MFSPAGQAALQGGSRSTYSGREVRQEPVRLARLEPTSRVMANGLFMSALLRQQPVLADVAIRDGLQLGNDVHPRLLAEEGGVTLLGFQGLLHLKLGADGQPGGDLAVLRREPREKPSLLGQPRHPDRLVGSRA